MEKARKKSVNGYLWTVGVGWEWWWINVGWWMLDWKR